MNPLHPWWLLTLGPIALTCGALIALRRTAAWAMAAAVLIAVLAIANTTVANSLHYVYTI